MKYFTVQLIKFSCKFKVLGNHSYFEFSAIGMQRGWDSSILILSLCLYSCTFITV
jgi:hypothetical protein